MIAVLYRLRGWNQLDMDYAIYQMRRLAEARIGYCDICSTVTTCLVLLLLTEFHTRETRRQRWIVQPDKGHQQVLSGRAWSLPADPCLLPPV